MPVNVVGVHEHDVSSVAPTRETPRAVALLESAPTLESALKQLWGQTPQLPNSESELGS
jgi:hypothetical protein